MRLDNILSKSVFHISGTTLDENIRNTVTFIKKLKQNNKITNYNQIAILFSHFKDRSAKKIGRCLKKRKD